MPTGAEIAVGALANAAAKRASEGLVSKITSHAGSLTSSILDRLKVAFRVGFESYLESTYQKCRFYKTVLNPYDPADLKETYVHVNLQTPGSIKYHSDKSVFNMYHDSVPLVISGTAGCGKSMFMRYLVIDSFEHLRSGVPLFVELRRLNEREEKNLISFILEECSQKGKGVTLAQFEIALRERYFCLILDGFDEIEYEFRDSISKQIVKILQDFPGISVVVSSRPDEDRFRGWAQFKVLKICEFTLAQAVELVEKADYNEGVKSRFLEAVSTKLSTTHKTFLASPLLTTIMLLTFEEYAEIPSKMYSFYSRAFDTLFQKHDADKDQYTRKLKTRLSKEDFKTLFSCFCAMTYLANRHSFKKDYAMNATKQATEYARRLVPDLVFDNPDDFIADLTEAVCMLQRDGLDLSFVHRSFQEYFMAVFIQNSHGDKVRGLLDKTSRRIADSVCGMAYEMDKEKVEEVWLLPTISEFIRSYGPKSRRSTGAVFASFFEEFEFWRDGLHIEISVGKIRMENFGPVETVCRMFPVELGPIYLLKPTQNVDMKKFKERIIKEENKDDFNYSKLESVIRGLDTEAVQIRLGPKDSWWLDLLGFGESLGSFLEKLATIRDDSIKRKEERDKIISTFL